MSVMGLDGVTSFLGLKDVTIHVNVCDTVKLLARFPQCNGGKLEEAADIKCVFAINWVFESK